jgi:cysteinyl-tRNA synthetase
MRVIAVALGLALALCACGAGPPPGPGAADLGDPLPMVTPVASTVGFARTAPWLSFYGSAAQMGDLAKAAATFRIIDLDADPVVRGFAPAEIAQLKGGGQNRVISYLNLGSCEKFRDYWSQAPAGLVPCGANTRAQLGPYAGYADEVWMNPGDADYQRLILEHVAPRLVAQGVDGFFLDNLEVVEHGTATSNGPCDDACAQGGLDLVRRLKEKFPSMLLVMQNATSARTLEGTTGGIPFPALLDGVTHEEVTFPTADPQARDELQRWQMLALKPGGQTFFIGTEDYVGGCDNTTDARTAYTVARGAGFSPYATDRSMGQQSVCYWPF